MAAESSGKFWNTMLFILLKKRSLFYAAHVSGLLRKIITYTFMLRKVSNFLQQGWFFIVQLMITQNVPKIENWRIFQCFIHFFAYKLLL